MIKLFVVVIALLVHSTMSAQEGISFRESSWQEAIELAKQENKPVFIDFYTEWCGPCYNMAKQVFTLYSVGSFYNDNFISLKIDAEKGEGIALAKKYNIKGYPTYIFINPNSEEVIHRSSGRQEPETFIFTGKSALDSSLCSSYLTREFAKGNRNPQFLIDYAMYKGSIHDYKSVEQICDSLIGIDGYSLENKKIWNLFVKYVKGTENTLFKKFGTDFAKLERIHGQSATSMKLYNEVQYSKDKNMVASLPQFIGKEAVMMYIDYNLAFSAKDYAKAAKAADSLMAYNGVLYDEVCKFLYYVARSNLYGEYPAEWHDKCLEISRYVAYNHPNRDDAAIHQLYAQQLEMKATRRGNSLPAPAFGSKTYSMRPKDLKAKPKR